MSMYEDRAMNKENIFWSEFLDLYKSMPCLWKIKSEEYSNRILKNSCYNKMVEKLKEFDIDGNREKVVKKINSFRTNYKRELKKIKSSEKSGAGSEDVYESQLWYFHKLQFLEDQELSQQGRCTMEDSDQAEFTPPPKRKRTSVEDNLLEKACQKLSEGENTNFALAKGWAAQYAELPAEQKIFARSIINDTLFHGCLFKLNEKMAEDVHKIFKGATVQNRPNISRSSTPYTDDRTYSSQYSFVQSPQEYLQDRPIIINNEVLSPSSHQDVQNCNSPIVHFLQNFSNIE